MPDSEIVCYSTTTGVEQAEVVGLESGWEQMGCGESGLGALAQVDSAPWVGPNTGILRVWMVRNSNDPDLSGDALSTDVYFT